MDHKLTITAVALALFAFGCNEQQDREGQAEAADHGTIGHDDGGHDDADEAGTSIPAVTLKNGQRWEANPETTTGIANMVALIDTHTATPGDAKAVKAALEEEFGLIFERCTMTGEAHNQLHNYLIPIHQRFSGFEAGDANALAEMRSYLQTYADYFR